MTKENRFALGGLALLAASVVGMWELLPKQPKRDAVYAMQMAQSSTPATVAANNGSPIIAGMPCDVGQASPNSTTVLDDLSIQATNTNTIWKCRYNPTNSTYSWQAPYAVAQPTGVFINQTGIAGGMNTQTICAANLCPAGFYTLDFSIVVTTGAALGSLNSATLAFTDDAGAASVSLTNCSSLSLLSAGTRCSATYSFYKTTAASTVTVATTVGSLTGTPAYAVRAALVKVF